MTNEPIKHIHANFSRNGLVEETADKINEIIDVVNGLAEGLRLLVKEEI